MIVIVRASPARASRIPPYRVLRPWLFTSSAHNMPARPSDQTVLTGCRRQTARRGDQNGCKVQHLLRSFNRNQARGVTLRIPGCELSQRMIGAVFS